MKPKQLSDEGKKKETFWTLLSVFQLTSRSCHSEAWEDRVCLIGSKNTECVSRGLPQQPLVVYDSSLSSKEVPTPSPPYMPHNLAGPGASPTGHQRHPGQQPSLLILLSLRATRSKPQHYAPGNQYRQSCGHQGAVCKCRRCLWW